MRIAIVAQPFDLVPPTRGGSLGIWADELAKELSHKHEVTIYSRRADDRPDEEIVDGVRHIRADTTRDDKMHRLFQRVERLLNRLLKRQTYLFYACYYFTSLYYGHYVKAVSKRIAAGDDELIVVINFSQFIPQLRSRNRLRKMMLVMQCDWLKELEPSRTGKRIRQVDFILGCSDYIANGIAQQYPEHSAKCHTLYNASNLQRFRIVNHQSQRAKDLKQSLQLGDKIIITFVGRVAPEKGVHVLVEAMKKVTALRPNTILLVVGGFSIQPPSPLWLRHKDPRFREIELLKQSYSEHLTNLCKNHEESIRLLGSVSHYELASYYEITDVFVHPAVWDEPFGMILTEAMASRCPVVSTRAGGIPEIVVDGETGLLVEPDNAEALAAAIIDLADNKEKRRSMGEYGQKRANDCFSWSVAAKRFNEILESVSKDA